MPSERKNITTLSYNLRLKIRLKIQLIENQPKRYNKFSSPEILGLYVSTLKSGYANFRKWGIHR